jgi:ribosomal protein S18 acetylase RimI-like enzyme
VASYRFCRTDDLRLLADAHNACYQPYVDGVAPLSVDDLKRSAREIQFWTSSCMVAFEGREPIGVMLACKREPHETLIWRLGVREDERRRGHARHLLTSLSAKLAILGPPRLVAELDAGDTAARALLERCEWGAELEYRDHVLRGVEGAPSPLVIPITVDELAANDALAAAAADRWERSPQTLRNRSEQLRGLAIASEARIEAWMLYRTEGESASVAALGAADPSRWEVWLAALLGSLASAGREIRLERIHGGEIPVELLRARGFEPERSFVRYATTAREA